MNKTVHLPLDSYRLAQFAVQVPCYVCGGETALAAERCRHCCAPVALTNQALAQKKKPQHLAILGAPGAGKSVYLGLLMDMLSRHDRGMKILPRGAFSISLQHSVSTSLALGYFPNATPIDPAAWNWVHCQVRHRRTTELIVPDISGDAMLTEMDHPGTFPAVHSLLAKCTGILIVIDAERLQSGDRTDDFFAMKLLTFLAEADGSRSRRKSRRPLGIVFAKCDACEQCHDDPEAFAASYAAGLMQQCNERFGRTKVFATSVAGATGYRDLHGLGRRHVPLRVEPRGLVAPFEWALNNMPRHA